MQNMFSDTFLCTPKLIPKNSKNLDDSFLIRMTMSNNAKLKVNAKILFQTLFSDKNSKKSNGPDHVKQCQTQGKCKILFQTLFSD